MVKPRVTDHALVRFLERAGGIDVEALRTQLADGLVRSHTAARSISESDYLINVDGLVLVVRGECVTTVIDADEPKSNARQLGQTRQR